MCYNTFVEKRDDYMYSLLIDTHDLNLLFVLYKDGKTLDVNLKESERHHSDYAMPMLKELLDRNNINVHDLNEILVVNGPGSFTGVRIGVTIAKTLAYTLNIPIKTISSLAIKAISVDEDVKVPVINDLKGVFSGVYDKDNNLIDEMFYLPNEAFKDYLKEHDYEDKVIDEVKYDYDKIYAYSKTIESENAHGVKPIYIKQIEAEKHD
jgi:tRNA threonylcarbamoyladenosine biosynthesis protein TsaB